MLYCLQNPQARGAKTAQITSSSQKVNERDSTLTLLMLGVLTDHAHHAIAADDLAVAANPFY
jgi:hypothetical protein